MLMFLLGCAVGAFVAVGLMLWAFVVAVRVISRDQVAKEIARRQIDHVASRIQTGNAMPQASETVQ